MTDRIFAARGQVILTLCCALSILAAHDTHAAVQSGFVRIVDPDEPVQNLGPIVEKASSDSQTLSLPTGPLTLRFPPSCRASLGPLTEIFGAGFKKLAEISKPLPVHVESSLTIVDNRGLPLNVRYTSPDPNSQIVLAPTGCDDEGWWRQDAVWDNLVRHFFHETWHVVSDEALPRRTPQWLAEGAAAFVSFKIDADLSLRFRGKPIPEAPLIARFIGEPDGRIEAVFDRSGNHAVGVESGSDALDAYALYLGGFLAAERIEDRIFDRLVEIGHSKLSKRRKTKALRAIDPRTVHDHAQSLRTRLIDDALAAARGRAEIAYEALTTLGWLGECPEPVTTSPLPDCAIESVDLAPYYGTCLERARLETIIAGYAACGTRLPPTWRPAVRRYCRRFPESARAFLSTLARSPSSEDSRPLLHCERSDSK